MRSKHVKVQLWGSVASLQVNELTGDRAGAAGFAAS